MAEAMSASAPPAESAVQQLDGLGGEAAIFNSFDALQDEFVLVAAVEALVGAWDMLADPVKGAAFIVRSIQVSPVEDLNDLLDIVLTHHRVVPALADDLEDTFSELSRSRDLRADVALEGWARLALGGWCHRAEVAGSLSRRVRQVSGTNDGSPYLVRALGAVMDAWPTMDLCVQMEILSKTGGHEADAAFELGLYEIGRSASSATTQDAVEHLTASRAWLGLALSEEGRPDAAAFKEILDLIDAYASGESITDDDVNRVEALVYDYLEGFVGEASHWRQPRTETSAAWLQLIRRLRDVGSATMRPWLNAEALMSAMGDVYAAHRTMALISRPAYEGPTPTVETGVAVLLRPQLEKSICGYADAVAFLSAWIEQIPGGVPEEARTEQQQAVVELRDTLLQQGDEDGDGERPQERDHEAALLQAFGDDPRLAAVFAAFKDSLLPWDAEQEAVVQRLIQEVKATAADRAAAYLPALHVMVYLLVRVTEGYLNEVSSGTRSTPWLGLDPQSDPIPGEDVLADDLARHFRVMGLDVSVETQGVAGGRVDVLVRFKGCTFSVEVKREKMSRTRSELTSQYGMQSVQYAGSSVATAFLAILDFGHRDDRIDLNGVLWVTGLKPNEDSRNYALVSTRVQANVDSPSRSSRRARKPRS